MKKKQIGVVLTSALIIAVTIIGVTLALLTSTTEVKANTFSSNKNISIELREPTWDGYNFGDATESTGDKAVSDSMDLGFNQAHNYYPGQIISKDPKVKNTGKADGGVEAYVAIKVTYLDENNNSVTYEEFAKKYLAENGINFSEKWNKIQTGTEDIYMYNSRLAVEQTTEALFTQVNLSTDLQATEEGTLPNFNIKVQAFAIQTNGIDNANATETMLNFIK